MFRLSAAADRDDLRSTGQGAFAVVDDFLGEMFILATLYAELLIRGRFLPRPPERAHAQIEEHDHEACRHQKLDVIGPVRPTGPNPPQRWTKHKQGQQKKDAHYFEPQNPAHAPEWPQKSANAPRQTTGYTCRRPARGPAPYRCIPGWGACRRSDRRAARALRAVADVLSGNAPCHAQSDSQHPSDGLRSHFDMMVAATVGTLLHHSLPDLPVALGPLRT